MIIIIAISLSLLVIVAGLLLLAKTKKEALGGLFTFSSYAIISIGILLTAFAFVGCVISCCSSRGGCGSASYSQCHGGGSGYGDNAAYGKCHRGSFSHGQYSRSTCSKKGCSKSACSKGSDSCKKGGKRCGKEKEKETQKIIKQDEDSEANIDVSTEIIE